MHVFASVAVLFATKVRLQTMFLHCAGYGSDPDISKGSGEHDVCLSTLHHVARLSIPSP